VALHELAGFSTPAVVIMSQTAALCVNCSGILGTMVNITHDFLDHCWNDNPNQNTMATRGYMYQSDDWKNMEMTGYSIPDMGLENLQSITIT
jgi:hypothetical protein